MLPEGVLKISKDERFILWAELQRGRLHVLEQGANGGLITRKNIPISIGLNGYGKEQEGDKRTPVGLYRLTSFLDDDRLIDYYGLGAYPLNYPNALDRRLQRTGSGIWLHGLPKDVDQRPPLDSAGCVIVDNTSLLEMADYIDPGVTHIVLTEGELRWQPEAAVRARRQSLETAFERWRESWAAKDNAAYLSYYSQDFDSPTRNKAQWDAYKTRVNSAKSSIHVDVSNVSFFVHPEAPELVSIRYYQRYRSNNYKWNGWKEQLWQEEDAGGWRIVYEGNGG